MPADDPFPRVPCNEATDLAIRIAKSALWEQAKGLLRGVALVSGQHSSVELRYPVATDVERAVEGFIKDFEDNGLHE